VALVAPSGATPLLWWPRSDFTREELELSTKLNTLALLLVPLLPLPHEQEQCVAKATAEMLQRLENDQGIAPAEKEFERAQEVERSFDKDFDGLDSA
jgi:hypothetical protein